MADALFAIIYAAFLKNLEGRLEAHGLWSSPATASSDSAVPTWADDTAVLFTSRHTADVTSDLATFMACAYDGLRRLGLAPNLNAGKTEVILMIQGKGAKAVRRRFSDFCQGVPSVASRSRGGRAFCASHSRVRSLRNGCS